MMRFGRCIGHRCTVGFRDHRAVAQPESAQWIRWRPVERGRLSKAYRGHTYFGTTDWLPPGDPGGGITGVVAAARPDGCTAIPGSTLGGVIVPFCRDN